MAAAMPSVFSSKLKLIEPSKSLVEGSKFIKWSEPTLLNDKSNPTPAACVNLKVDEKCFILYWRDVNAKSLKSATKELVEVSCKSYTNKFLTKSEFLDIALIRDVKTGKYANLPKDKNTCGILMSGKSSASIREKTITIYYGPDFVNLQSINFVSLSDNAHMIAKTWSEFLFQAATNQRAQNLSPYENLLKLRTCLLYGKSVFDERTLEYRLPVQTIIETFVISSNKQTYENDKLEVLNALNSVGLPCSKSETIDEKMLTVEKFFNFFLQLISKNLNIEITKIFSKYKAAWRKTWLLNDEKFEKFLNVEQRDPSLNELLYPFVTTDKAAELIKKFEVDDTYRKKRFLTINGLIRYLMDFENEIIDPIKYELHEDMEQPMSHYFVNSSHNTYLAGHQITGKSDAEMYRQVLLSGCRCIELDCHEDESLDEPIITHGRTLCTKILFRDAIYAIKECAFKTSPYPVFLSFENYCGKRMQEKMATYLIEILEENLLREPLPDYPLESGVPLPSPEQLKYKILCKFRKKISNP